MSIDGVVGETIILTMGRPQVWMNVGDVILLSLREFQDAKGDIILKYTADEARSLKSLGEIPETGKSQKPADPPGAAA